MEKQGTPLEPGPGLLLLHLVLQFLKPAGHTLEMRGTPWCPFPKVPRADRDHPVLIHAHLPAAHLPLG